MSTICESSPWANEKDRLATIAQWEVMRELHLDSWDPTNAEAVGKLQEIMNETENPTTLAKNRA